jgi:hypothetical protein
MLHIRKGLLHAAQHAALVPGQQVGGGAVLAAVLGQAAEDGKPPESKVDLQAMPASQSGRPGMHTCGPVGVASRGLPDQLSAA